MRILPAATAPKLHSPALGGGSTHRPGGVAMLADDGQLDDASAAARVSMVAPVLGLDAFPDLHLWRTPADDPYEAGMPRAARLRIVAGKVPHLAQPVVDQYRVVIDAARGSAASAWTLLDAGAAQTAVVTLPEYRSRLAGDLRDEVAIAADAVPLMQEVIARITQPELRDREALRLHRAVLAGHTFGDRVDTVLAAVGRPAVLTDRSVSVVVPTNRVREIDNVLANVGRQVHREVELILVLHGIEIAEAGLRAMAADHGVERLKVLRAEPRVPLGAVLNMGVDAAEGRYLAKMDDDNFYGQHYLTDLVNSFASTDAGVVGKWAHYVWLRSADAVVLRYPNVEHRYHRLVQGGSIVADREIVQEFRFSELPRAVDTDFLNRVWVAGVKTYSSDRFNFISIRGSDRAKHTWKVADVEIMAGGGTVVFYGDPRAHVEV